MHFLAIACEKKKHAKNDFEYRIWYVEINAKGKVCRIGIKSCEQLISSAFNNLEIYGSTLWRALPKGATSTNEIKVTDFMCKNFYENTHFGYLPNLAEFQDSLNYIEKETLEAAAA